MSGVRHDTGTGHRNGDVTVGIFINGEVWYATESPGSDPTLVTRVIDDLTVHVTRAALESVTYEDVNGPQSAATHYTASQQARTGDRGPCAVCGCVIGCHLGSGVIQPQGHAYRAVGDRPEWMGDPQSRKSGMAAVESLRGPRSYTPNLDAVLANQAPYDACLVCGLSKLNHDLTARMAHKWADPRPRPAAETEARRKLAETLAPYADAVTRHLTETDVETRFTPDAVTRQKAALAEAAPDLVRPTVDSDTTTESSTEQ